MQRPRGLTRILARMPIWLYRLHLGWILDGRFLLLTHVGRKSGLPRQVVLEVVKHDPATGVVYVASGFGRRSDWFRNILKTPEVTVQMGNRRWKAVAQVLPQEEAAEILAEYAREHPKAARSLARLLGYPADGSPDSFRALAKEVPIVALRPR